MIPLPIELLQSKLDELVQAKDKSRLTFEEGRIKLSEHETHMENLTPKIESYRFAIKHLNKIT